MRDLNYGRMGTETGCEAEEVSASKKQLTSLLAAAQGLNPYYVSPPKSALALMGS